MPYADLGQYKYHYLDMGAENEKNGILLLLHAFTLDHRMWQTDAEYFAQHYRVIVPDLKGHGKSDAPQSGYTRADRVEDMLRFLNCLNINAVHLVGLSYGGTTGIGLALKYPERLKSLTLVGTSAAGFDLGPKISKIDRIAREKGIDAAKEKWVRTSVGWYGDDKAEIKKLVETMMRDHSGAIWSDPMRGNYPKEYDLEKVSSLNIPISIIVGSEDRIFLPLARQLHELIPNSKLNEFENIGHLVNLEAPENFRSVVGEYLKKL